MRNILLTPMSAMVMPTMDCSTRTVIMIGLMLTVSKFACKVSLKFSCFPRFTVLKNSI